jgi:hypothetical protein
MAPAKLFVPFGARCFRIPKGDAGSIPATPTCCHTGGRVVDAVGPSPYMSTISTTGTSIGLLNPGHGIIQNPAFSLVVGSTCTGWLGNKESLPYPTQIPTISKVPNHAADYKQAATSAHQHFC